MAHNAASSSSICGARRRLVALTNEGVTSRRLFSECDHVVNVETPFPHSVRHARPRVQRTAATRGAVPCLSPCPLAARANPQGRTARRNNETTWQAHRTRPGCLHRCQHVPNLERPNRRARDELHHIAGKARPCMQPVTSVHPCGSWSPHEHLRLTQGIINPDGQCLTSRSATALGHWGISTCAGTQISVVPRARWLDAPSPSRKIIELLRVVACVVGQVR